MKELRNVIDTIPNNKTFYICAFECKHKFANEKNFPILTYDIINNNKQFNFFWIGEVHKNNNFIIGECIFDIHLNLNMIMREIYLDIKYKINDCSNKKFNWFLIEEHEYDIIKLLKLKQI